MNRHDVLFTLQAWMKLNLVALCWRFSHINYALEDNPQDVFHQP
jgi:hypothetical protein